MKNQKGIMGIIGALIIVSLLIVCYLLFGNKLLNGNKLIKDISELPQEMNANVVKSNPISLLSNDILKTNFSNYKSSIGNINYVFDCTKYGESFNNQKACLETKVSFNSISYIEETSMTEQGCGHSIDVLTYKDFIILLFTEGCIDAANFKIYDIPGNLLYSPYNTAIADWNSNIRYNIVLKNKSYNTINIVNDILYYTEVSLNNNQEHELLLKYIDLNSSKLNSQTITEIKDAEFGYQN